MNFKTYTFETLTLQQLYELLALRAAVFIVEQKAVYQDLDGWDPVAHHLCLFEKDKLIAYARLLPANSKFTEVSFGRFVVAESHRAQGIGKKLLHYILQQCEQYYGKTAIRIEAQHYLERFYQAVGFQTLGEPYILDDVLHIDMLRTG